jgi:hypothetical protein
LIKNGNRVVKMFFQKYSPSGGGGWIVCQS